ncbi:acetate--CoA ligase family protein [Pelobacter propionicus]|uniref:CoA-binding domain protein n=1 Tax=Pelobacter propionicus (strain DSM 2379 / NBRC 103807 / OttBd1) TaxID=338966 RepID=A1APD4_PELPD|nr:CoA-binding protein [Pelobacter propionicus]ABK99204.1 CoA-binding domain protein [Pelobacter propionicus DSM 2379]
MAELDSLFSPTRVALIGAAASEEKLGGIVLKNLLGLKGEVYPVNPNYAELMGRTAYRSIGDLPCPVDLSIIMRPAAEVPGILHQHAGKVRFALIVSAGFAEVGAWELQEEIKHIGREAGIRLIGPNCLGVYNPRHGLDTMFLPHALLKKPGKGNVAIVSQSGALVVCLLEAVRQANMGVSKVINYGNAVDLDAADVYEYLAEDRETRVVISYLESVGNGRRFIEAARNLDNTKPLLVLKAGKGAGGQKAACSHTGRLAGSYEVFRSILRQFRIQEAIDYESLLDGAKALSLQRPASGKRVCVITNGGGSGVLAADECGRAGLELPPLPEAVVERLIVSFPSFYAIANPIDLTGQVRAEDYRVALDAVREAYDGFIVIALTAVSGVTLAVAEMVHDFSMATGKPVVAHVAQGGISRKLARLMEKGKIPVYPSPERAVRALAMLLHGRGDETR